MMLCFIILCVAIMMVDEARKKGYDLKRMRDIISQESE
jgi:hypothetical protein